MRISDWSSDVCSSDLTRSPCRPLPPVTKAAWMNGQWPRMIKQRCVRSCILPATCMQLDTGQPAQAGSCKPDVPSPWTDVGPPDPVYTGHVHSNTRVRQTTQQTAHQTLAHRQDPL